MKINFSISVRYFLPLAVMLWGRPAISADWAGTISSANPLHWFRFEETSGTVADDQGSANTDGTYVGAVGLGTPGLVGNAASFDAGSHVFLGQPNLPADWTVETIFKADPAIGGASMGLLGADFTGTDRMALKAEQWNKTGQMGYTLFGVVDITFTDPQAATPTDYTHVVFVGQSSGVSLYVNGALVGQDPTATPLARWAIATGAIRGDGRLIDPLSGAIDELVIYDRALSEVEIAEHFAAVPEPASLALLLPSLLALLGIRRRR